MTNEELKKEIVDILDNVIYWETCPEDYKNRINNIKKELSQPTDVKSAEEYRINWQKQRPTTIHIPTEIWTKSF